MAFGDVLFIYEVSVSSGEPTVTITNTPTAGNLLIYGVGRSATHTSGGAWGTPSEFADVRQTPINTGNMAGAWFYKISEGDETSVVTTGTNTQGNAMAMVLEIEGPFEASPLDVAAENEENLSTVVTSQTSGTTGTTAQNDELALAFFAFDRSDTVDGTRAYSNSFTEVNFNDASAARAGCGIAKKILSATGTVECTFSVTDTGDEMYGSVATFKKLAEGGEEYTQSVDGAMTPAGTATKQGAKVVAGSVSSIVGALTNQANKVLAGAISAIAGTLTKQVDKVLSGAIETIEGTLARIKTALISLSGAITPAGEANKSTGKSLAGTLTDSGAVILSVAKTLAGSVSTIAGTITKQANKVLSGDVSTITGAIVRSCAKALAGTVTTAGTVNRLASKLLSGAISSIVGALSGLPSSGATPDAPGFMQLREIELYGMQLKETKRHDMQLKETKINDLQLGEER